MAVEQLRQLSNGKFIEKILHNSESQPLVQKFLDEVIKRHCGQGLIIKLALLHIIFKEPQPYGQIYNVVQSLLH